MKFCRLSLVFQTIFKCFFLLQKAPVPIDPWKPKVLDAFEHGPICIQPVVTIMDLPFPQSEDCLTLNVYVPGMLFEYFTF